MENTYSAFILENNINKNFKINVITTIVYIKVISM